MSAQRESDYEGEPDFDDAHLEDDLDMDPDRPRESDDQVTVREQLQGDSMNTRFAREEPDVEARPEDRVGRLVEQTVGGRDVTKELEADETADRDDLSPEERALHHESE